MAFPDLTNDQLVAICERHGLVRGPFSRLASTGIINTIYAIGNEWVLRLPKNVGAGLRDTFTESVAVPVVVAAGVQTPPLVAFDERCDLVEVPYGIYERVHAIDGYPGTPEGWRDLGRDLARLHGGVTSCPDPLGRLDVPGRWSTVDEALAALPGLAETDHRALERSLRRLEDAVLEWERTGQRRFLHNDVKGSNVMVDGGRYVAIIDWGDAGWGDPAIDFRTIPPEATSWVLEGYGSDDPTLRARIRWDQLGATARRLGEPRFRARHETLLSDR